MEDIEKNDCHYIYKQVLPHMQLQASFTIYAMENIENDDGQYTSKFYHLGMQWKI